MRIVSATLSEFESKVKCNGLKIVVYGFGVIGSMVAPYIIKDLNLEGNVLFFCDKNKYKQGESVCVGDRIIRVVSPEVMAGTKEAYIILITGSHYSGIVEELSNMSFMKNVDIYILPHMLAQKSNAIKKQKLPGKKHSIIPKKIHYCWFGNKAIPDELKKYMESWGKYCPDYEIIRWDENNVDMDKYPYIAQAYKHGKWGYIPDMVRLDVLYNHGGIYLDTDVELLRPIDELLGLKGFCATEKWGIVNIGGGCGVVPNHPMIKEILDYRRGIEFERKDGSLNLESSGSYETRPLFSHGFIPNNTLQTINDFTILTSDFFHPFDYMTKETHITENTYAIHHFYGSWRN